MYAIKIQQGAITEYSSEYSVRRELSNVAFPAAITQEDLTPFNIFLIAKVEPPSYTPSTHKVIESYDIDTLQQTWEILPLTEEELEARIPRSVTMRQGRLALLQAGYLAQVNAAIQGIEDPVQKAAAEIEWEYAQTIDRDSTFTQALAAQLGLTDLDLNNLFTLASTL